jgi:hypothetical protein
MLLPKASALGRLNSLFERVKVGRHDVGGPQTLLQEFDLA